VSRYRVCILCMAEGRELAYLVVRWRQPIDGRAFTAGPRCVDRAGCRARVEASGETWEVLDAGDPMPTVQGRPTPVGKSLGASTPPREYVPSEKPPYGTPGRDADALDREPPTPAHEPTDVFA
jgi:hypothetical protein